MEPLGFSYRDVHERRPGLIFASISGFGDSGPERTRPGYDVIVQGEAGIMDLAGPVDGAPHKIGTSVADLASGLTLTQGIWRHCWCARERVKASTCMCRCTRRLLRC